MSLKKAMIEDAAARNVLAVLDRVEHFKKMQELYGPKTPRQASETPKDGVPDATNDEDWLFI